MSETSLSIGIQGGRGSFNEQACFLYCEEHEMTAFQVSYLYTTERVLQQLAQQRVDFGVFAITNSLSGIIMESLEALSKHNCLILDVFDMPVHYALLAKSGKTAQDIRVIMSHPAILDGCRERLARDFSDKKISNGEGILIDQAAAAAYLAESGAPNHVAVIAPKVCAKLFGLDMLEELMEDRESITTFVWCKNRPQEQIIS